jgi:von Willebrand factor type A domain
MFMLITNVFVCHASSDYSDEYEEIPDTTPGGFDKASTTARSIVLDQDDEDRLKLENDVIKEHLDTMSATFRKIVNKIKMKHKRLEMIFLVDSSSSVGKENFVNEISFVKRLLSDFNVSFNYTRVALITFSSRSKIVSACFGLPPFVISETFQIVHINQISEASTDNDKCILLNHQIPNITYSGGGTNTYSALVKAKVRKFYGKSLLNQIFFQFLKFVGNF